MRSISPWRGAAACAALLACASPVLAQAPDPPGVRAQGMGGAFVAVADDASATVWNPAGLVNGPLVDATLQRLVARDPWDPAARPASDGGARGTSTFFAFALPSLGVSYLHTTTFAVGAPTANPSDSRQIDRPASSVVSRLVTDRVGLTLLQSLTDNFAVGTTVKVLRGTFGASPAANDSLATALDAASRLPGAGSTHVDLDVGILGWTGPIRAGLVGRNLRRPDFGSDAAVAAGADASLARLPRQVRAGFAVTPGFSSRAKAAQPTLTISVDADLTRTTTLSGAESRRIAAGVERWFGQRRLALRGGVQADTIGERRTVVTGGASVALRQSFFVEAYFGRGRAQSGGGWPAETWGIAGRAGF